MKKVRLNSIYAPANDNLVVREIYGEYIIVPIVSGLGDLDDAIFSLNETGRAIWDKLDGRRTLKNIVEQLSKDFTGSVENIEKDCQGFVAELLKRKMVIEIK